MSFRRRFYAISCVALVASSLARNASAQDNPPAAATKQTKPPKLLHFVEASYPESERAQSHAASVVLKLTLGVDGHVQEAVVTESAGTAFDEAALAAARDFVFEPAEVDHKPVRSRILYRYQFVLRAVAKTTGDLRGVVTSARDKRALAGVSVEVDGHRVTTDAAGKFSFDELAVGAHDVTLAGEGLTGLRVRETIEAGERRTVSYELTPKVETQTGTGDDYEVIVRAPALHREVVSTEVVAEEARRAPGTQGDVLKIVESMPGVGRSAAGSSSLVVWGAAPEDTRVYVDGVRVPMLYHLGGFRSIVHTDLVKSVELTPGGYGAAYGRGLGGLITVATKSPDAEHFHGSLNVDVLDASAMVSAPITDDLRIAVAARRSHLDSLVSDVTDRDVGVLVPIPRYRDAQVIAEATVSPRSLVRVGLLWSTDTVTRAVASSDPAARQSETNDIGFYRVFARYEHQTDDGASTNLVASFGHDNRQSTDVFGQTPASLSNSSQLLAMRATWRGRVLPFLTLTSGMDVEAVMSDLARHGSPTLPPREGDIRVFGQAPTAVLANDAWSTSIGSAAPFAEGDFELLDGALHMVPGVRFEPFITGGSRKTPQVGDTPAVGYLREDTAIEPRLAARARLNDTVSLKAALGIYHQSPQAEDLSARFGNPDLAPASGRHALLAVRLSLAESLDLETTGFETESSSLAIRSPLPSPALAQALVPEGRGRAYGIQTMLRRKLAQGFFGWISYALSRSERTDVPNGGYRLFDYDQTHVLTALASYDLGKGFEVGARIRYATGFPRTPVDGVFYDARLDSYQPLFGAHNSIRIPAFFQADLRVSKRFVIGPTHLDVYLDVQNITDRQNAEEIVYNRDYSQKSFITGLPILPVAGASWSW